VPYIQASEFVSILPNQVGTITGSSMPLTLSEVATICERVSIELNSAAAIAGYIVPVATGATQAYAQMALYNSWGAACLVLRTAFPGGAQGAEMALAQDYCDDYKNVLDRLRESTEILIGAPEDTGETGRVLARSYSTSFPLATSGVVPQTTVGQKF
jgi:hypothetical protein